jgi:hypothetical protein
MVWDQTEFCQRLFLGIILAIFQSIVLAWILNYWLGKRKDNARWKRINSVVLSFLGNLRESRYHYCFQNIAFLSEEDISFFEEFISMFKETDVKNGRKHVITLFDYKYTVNILAQNQLVITPTESGNGTFNSKMPSENPEIRKDFIDHVASNASNTAGIVEHERTQHWFWGNLDYYKFRIGRLFSKRRKNKS